MHQVAAVTTGHRKSLALFARLPGKALRSAYDSDDDDHSGDEPSAGAALGEPADDDDLDPDSDDDSGDLSDDLDLDDSGDDA
jgi:hypothetical protein